jgi:hypothetical protein
MWTSCIFCEPDLKYGWFLGRMQKSPAGDFRRALYDAIGWVNRSGFVTRPEKYTKPDLGVQAPASKNDRCAVAGLTPVYPHSARPVGRAAACGKAYRVKERGDRMKPEVQPNQPGQAPGPRSFFTSRKGKRFYAVDYGDKAWPIGKNGQPGKKK